MPISKRRELANEKNARERAKQEKQQKALNPELVDLCLNKDSKPQKPKRTRRFCLSTYIEVSAIDTFLKRSPWVQHWAYCTHDKDVLENGSPKQVHTHILLYTYNAKTASGVKKIFDRYSAEYYKDTDTEPQNTLVQECHDVVSQFRYLRHLDDKEKAFYNENEVFTDNLNYWYDLCKSQGMTDSAHNSGLAMFTDLLSGATTLDMIERYGKEYIYHVKQFKECLNDLGMENFKKTFESFEDMCNFALADAPFSQEQIECFKTVLMFVNTKCLQGVSGVSVNGHLKA